MTTVSIRPAGAVIPAALHLPKECGLPALPATAQEAEDEAVANAIYGSSSDEEDCAGNAVAAPRASPHETTLGRLSLAAATPRVCKEDTFAAAFSEDSCQHEAGVGVAYAPGDEHAAKAADDAPSSRPTAAVAAAVAAQPADAATLLLAKRLQASDMKKQRVVLPRAAVEAAFPGIAVQQGPLALQVLDPSTSQLYRVAVSSWTAGAGKRQYSLDQAGPFLRAAGLQVGDVLGLCRSSDGSLQFAVNTPAALAAVAGGAGAHASPSRPGFRPPPVAVPRGSSPAAAAAATTPTAAQSVATTPTGPAAAAAAEAGAVSAGAQLPRRRCVLVAKQLTNSDASSGRIILPRVAVESNLSFVLGYRHYALAVKDCHGRRYEFMIKSWANGTEHRRVFVLEQAGEFLRAHGVGVGDAVGICTDENGELVVEANSDEVRQATVSPKYGALALQAPPPGATAAVPLAAGASGRCIRSPHCTKAAGHPGFCSGPKAAAAAAAKQQQAAALKASAAAAAAAACQPGSSELSARGGVAATSTSGEEAATRLATPRARHAHAATSCAEYAAVPAAPPAPLPKLPEGLHDTAHIPAGLRLSKTLTGYDLTSRRVVMPVPAVQAGIANAPTSDLLTLAAVDESQRWQFPTLRAWTNVAGRRGYLLDGLAAWLEARGAQEGDCLMVFRDTDLTPPRIELRPACAAANAPPRKPAVPDTSAPTFASLPLLLHPNGSGPATAAEAAAAAGSGGHGRGLLLLNHRRGPGGMMVCRRTTTCTKPAGHQGFCSGHKGFKRRESPTASSALGARRPFGRYREEWLSEDDDEDEYLTASDDDSSLSYAAAAGPSRAAKRPRRAAAVAAAGLATVMASRDASPTPLPPASDPLLSLLSVLDCMETNGGAPVLGSGGGSAAAAACAVQEAVQTAEAAAHAAYGAVKGSQASPLA